VKTESGYTIDGFIPVVSIVWLQQSPLKKPCIVVSNGDCEFAEKEAIKAKIKSNFFI
jgi:hypothetical protein